MDEVWSGVARFGRADGRLAWAACHGPRPSAERTVRIIEFLAEYPERSFPLAELTRRLGMSHATAHALIATLVEQGWVRRASDRTLSVGPALVGIGMAARRGLRVVDEALPFMEALAEELELECQAGTVAGHDIVVVARTRRRSPFNLSGDVGQRAPLAPPLGAPYVAWSSPAEIDAYLDRADPQLSQAERTRMLRVLAAVRRRGYGVALDPATRRRLRDVAKQLAGGDRAVLRHELAELLRTVAEEEYATVDLDHDFSHDVTAIGAPVFGPDGSVVLVIGLVGFAHRLSGAQIPPYAERLLDVTGAVTAAVRGRSPAAQPAS